MRCRFGARYTRAFRLPAGGINVPLTRRETSRRSGSVAGWRQYWNAAFHPPSPNPLCYPCRPSALFLLPGLRVLYICLLHSKLETRRGARTDPGSGRATSKRWRIAMNIHAGKRNSPSLVIRTVTLIFSRLAWYSETKFELGERITGIIAKLEVLSYNKHKIEEIYLAQENRSLAI